MIKSMTGYGRGTASSDSGEFTVEIKTVNHRFRDISIRLPWRTYSLENETRKEIESIVARGKIDVTVSIVSPAGESTLEVDLPLAKDFHKALTCLKSSLQLEGEISLSQITAFKDVIRTRDVTSDEDALKKAIMPALKEALASLDGMRRKEGEALAKDLNDRLENIMNTADPISEKQPLLTEQYKERLQERIKTLTNGTIDEARLAQEAAIFAEKSDITEEIVRLKSHVDQFSTLLEQEGPTGRKLDFLVQEMNREINTIGSKSSDTDISTRVIEIKSELEKIKEQVQNIE